MTEAGPAMMNTRCPAPTCGAAVEIAIDNNRRGRCPNCGQIMTPRSQEILQALARKQAISDQPERGQLLKTTNNHSRFACLLEDVRSLYNVGSMFRTADGAGIDHLILSGITGCPPHKRMVKTSLGAEESVAWSYVENALEALLPARRAGMHVIGLEYLRDDPDFGSSQPLTDLLAGGDDLSVAGGVLLVVGNEVTGLSAEALSACQSIAHLPMHGSKESLNVAVAFGIAVYRLAEHSAALKTPCPTTKYQHKEQQ